MSQRTLKHVGGSHSLQIHCLWTCHVLLESVKCSPSGQIVCFNEFAWIVSAFAKLWRHLLQIQLNPAEYWPNINLHCWSVDNGLAWIWPNVGYWWPPSFSTDKILFTFYTVHILSHVNECSHSWPTINKKKGNAFACILFEDVAYWKYHSTSIGSSMFSQYSFFWVFVKVHFVVSGQTRSWID